MASSEIVRTKDVLIEDANLTFESLFLSTLVLSGLKDYKLTKPSPIQLKAIPLGKCGFDLIIKAKSGTGKTAVFSIIALEMIDCVNSELQVLILAPTREIAVQTCDVITIIGKYIKNLKVENFIGGLPISEDKNKAKGCHIAVGSPGRMLHLIKSGTLKMQHVKLFVLDEADNLMEQTFQADINQIYHHLPKNKQMLAVSATYPDELDLFLARYMHIPTHVSPQMDSPLLLGLKHFVSITNSNANVIHWTKIKNTELLRILTYVSFTQCLIFCNYQTRAEEVSNFLNRYKWKSNFISGAQTQKERLKALKQLKDFQCRILLSTDLTARGIDAVNVDLVVNYDVPNDESTYLHRMGRAGRYGTKGTCITLACKGEEVAKFRNIIGSIGGSEMTVPVLPVGELPGNIWDTSSVFETVSGTVNINERSSQTLTTKIVTSIREIRAGSKVFADTIENTPENDNNKDNKKVDLEVRDEKDNDSLQLVSVDRKLINYQDLEELTNQDPASVEHEENDAFELLKKLASGESVFNPEGKLKNHGEAVTEMVVSTSTNSLDTFTKNVSLLTVSSLLEDDKMDDDNDNNVVMAETIEHFITTLKAEGEEEEGNSAAGEMKTSDIEDVFIYAYDYAISKTHPDWTEVYSFNGDEEDSNKDEPVNLLQDFLEYAANEEEAEYEDFYKDGDYEDEDDEGMITKFGHTTEQAADPSLKWVPVQQNEKVVKTNYARKKDRADHESKVEIFTPEIHQDSYTQLYETAVSDFQQVFNTVEDVPSFEGVWENWQVQMSSIRDYVQQNIYLEEMNLYKSNKFSGV